jgi:hypothetical protein
VLRGAEDADECGVGDADVGGMKNPARRCRGGVFVGEVPVVIGIVPGRRGRGQSMTSLTAERAAGSSTRFFPAAKVAPRDCRARLLTARG